MMADSTSLSERFHNGFAYWIYSIMGGLAALIVIKLVPETKRKTLEEMENLWRKKESAIIPANTKEVISEEFNVTESGK